jgi:hypothetical protein
VIAEWGRLVECFSHFFSIYYIPLYYKPFAGLFSIISIEPTVRIFFYFSVKSISLSGNMFHKLTDSSATVCLLLGMFCKSLSIFLGISIAFVAGA